MKTIKIYDAIDPMWGYGLADLNQDLEEANGKDVHVKIQSGGGSVFEGLAIYNTLKNYEGNVTTEIVGISASIASIIFLAGSKRIVNEVGFLMIHEAWTMTMGNADDLREDAELLDQINSQILDIYQNVTGYDRDELKEKMSKDTYMGPEELKEMGFVTEISEGAKIAASLGNHLNLAKGEKMAKDEKAPEASIEELQKQIVALQEKIESNDKLILEKDAEIEKIKAEQDEKVQIALKAEKERENEILASIAHPSQLEFAKDLVAKGETVVNAKIALFDDLRANKDTYLKVEKEQGVNILEAQAPKANGPTAEQQESIVVKWKAIKDPAAKKIFYNENKLKIEKELK